MNSQNASWGYGCARRPRHPTGGGSPRPPDQSAVTAVEGGGYWASCSSAGASAGGSSSFTGSGTGFKLILPGSAVNNCPALSAAASPMYSSTPHGAVAATSG